MLRRYGVHHEDPPCRAAAWREAHSLHRPASAACFNDPLGGLTCAGPYTYGDGSCEGYDYVAASLWHYDPVLTTYAVIDAIVACGPGYTFNAASAHVGLAGAYIGGSVYDTADENSDYASNGAGVYAGYGGSTLVGVGMYQKATAATRNASSTCTPRKAGPASRARPRSGRDGAIRRPCGAPPHQARRLQTR